MERGLLSDGVIQEILQQSLETKFSRFRPATRHFFTSRAGVDDHPQSVSIHKWVIADIAGHDSRAIVQNIADTAVKEVARVAVSLTGEMVFARPHLMPPPFWEDGEELFAESGVLTEDRFGVPGGNVVSSTGCYADDVRAAAERLQELDPSLEIPYERLMAFCPKPLEKKLIRGSAKAKIPCKVFGIYNYKDETSWVLTRDESPCSLLIGKPDFPLKVKGSKIVVGARFTVWIDDPRNAVRVISTQE